MGWGEQNAGGRQACPGPASLTEVEREIEFQEPADVRRVIHEVSEFQSHEGNYEFPDL